MAVAKLPLNDGGTHGMGHTFGQSPRANPVVVHLIVISAPHGLCKPYSGFTMRIADGVGAGVGRLEVGDEVGDGTGTSVGCGTGTAVGA